MTQEERESLMSFAVEAYALKRFASLIDDACTSWLFETRDEFTDDMKRFKDFAKLNAERALNCRRAFTPGSEVRANGGMSYAEGEQVYFMAVEQERV